MGKHVYHQATGQWHHFGDDGQDSLLGTGWAGHGAAKNDPAADDQVMVGPLPKGTYGIRSAIHHPRLGVIAMELVPDPGNDMHGRSGFWVHGPSMDPTHYGQESDGCVIQTHEVRSNIADLVEAGDDRLEVVA